MVVLVTGGAGFIGSNVVHELLVRGVLGNFSTGHRQIGCGNHHSLNELVVRLNRLLDSEEAYSGYTSTPARHRSEGDRPVRDP